MNVLRWCPFVHLFDTHFQNSPYSHDISLKILSVNSVYNFSELHLPYSLNFTANKENIRNKSSVTGFQHAI